MRLVYARPGLIAIAESVAQPIELNSLMKTISIRPSFVTYVLPACVLTTVGTGLLKAGLKLPALSCFLLLIPAVLGAALDRIEFDGLRIRRRGFSSAILGRALGLRQQLAVAEIETITTESTSFSFATGDARLIYHTRVSGRGIDMIIRSRRAAYIPFIRALFRAVGPNRLDPRSFELFEYFEGRQALKDSPILKSEISALPSSRLRRIANSLRLAGRLAQAASYFRIAYEKEPRNPTLLYDMSRFFRASAQTVDARLLQRSDACLRLAARLAGEDAPLLERIGEAFFERLDYKRATDCFQRALAGDRARFRANVGLAEIALRDGKLAHVAHFYNAAAASNDLALAGLAEREARYYERLMGDDDFLQSELRRIRTANQVRWGRRLAALTFFFAWIGGGLAGRFYPFANNFGLALMTTSGAIWCGAMLLSHYLKRR